MKINNEEIETAEIPTISGVISFHGLNLIVAESKNTEYVYLKNITDLIGIDWRSAKNTAFESDNSILYGTTWFQSPNIASVVGNNTPRSKGVWIRLDRAHFFLARLNTAKIRSKGNLKAAEYLLELQIEWAEAINSYENNGYAIKQATKESQLKREQNLNALMKTRNSTIDEKEKLALTMMIRDKLAELGYPVDGLVGKQISMDV